MDNHPLAKNIRAIISWCFFDFGNSAFPVVVTTFIFATYFTQHIAPNAILGTHLWGNAIAIAGLGIALLSPICGAIADHYGRHKVWLGIFTLITIISSALLWFAYPSANYIYYTLICVIFGILGIEIGMVFYNAMLPILSPPNYIGRISGWSWGMGYFGGLIALIISLFGFINGKPHWLDISTAGQVRICGPFIAAWFLIFSLPLFLFVPNLNHQQISLSTSIKQGLNSLGKTLKQLPKHRTVFLYLIAHMIYIDGLNTIFAFGGIYAAGTFHMNLDEVIIFGIAMNVAAGLGSIGLAWVDDLIGSKLTIMLSLIFLTFLSLGMVLVQQKLLFWILGFVLCLFVGPVQSASRSLMAKLVEKDNAMELFGLYNFSGKVTTFLGPLFLGFFTLKFQSQRVGMATIIIFFLIGGFILRFVSEKKNYSHGAVILVRRPSN